MTALTNCCATVYRMTLGRFCGTRCCRKLERMCKKVGENTLRHLPNPAATPEDPMQREIRIKEQQIREIEEQDHHIEIRKQSTERNLANQAAERVRRAKLIMN